MPKPADGSRHARRKDHPNRKNGSDERDDAPDDKSSDKDAADGSRLRVLVIRHAVAEEREAFARTGEADGLRPLTKDGRRKMRRAARGLVREVPKLHLLATSPLTRAVETADIVANQYGAVKTATVAALSPGKPANALLAWLQDHPPGVTVAVVGHEPDLGQFVSWALTGLRESFIPLKKGGACLLDFPDDVKPGRAQLLWLLKPSQLREIGAAG